MILMRADRRRRSPAWSTALLIAYGQLVPFIVTLAMLVSARGLAAQIASNRTQIVDSADDQRTSPATTIARRPAARRDPRGRGRRSAGCCSTGRPSAGARSPSAATPRPPGSPASTSAGTPSCSTCISGLCCGIAAVMLMARTTTGSSTHGELYELDAIAAAIIGGTLLTGGRGTIIGSLLGVLVFTTITNIFILNNLATETQNIAKGVIIVAAVLLQRRATLRSRRHLGDPSPPRPPSRHPERPAPSAPPIERGSTMSPSPRRPPSSAAAACSSAPAPSAPARSSPPAPATAVATPRPRRASGRRTTGGRQRRPRQGGHHRLLGARGRPRLDRRHHDQRQERRPAKYSDVTLKAVEGTQRRQPADQPGRDPDQQEGRRIVILPFDGKALTEIGLKAHGGRHPGRQPRPRVRRPARRRAPGSRATTTAWASPPGTTSPRS